MLFYCRVTWAPLVSLVQLVFLEIQDYLALT